MGATLCRCEYGEGEKARAEGGWLGRCLSALGEREGRAGDDTADPGMSFCSWVRHYAGQRFPEESMLGWTGSSLRLELAKPGAFHPPPPPRPTPAKTPPPFFHQATPLHVAAAAGHSSACRMLLDAGARQDLPDGTLRTPLHLAREGSHMQVRGLPASACLDMHGARAFGTLGLSGE
jgi:hypothetical protein